MKVEQTRKMIVKLLSRNVQINYCTKSHSVTYSSLVHENFIFSKVRHILERIYAYQNRANVCLQKNKQVRHRIA